MRNKAASILERANRLHQATIREDKEEAQDQLDKLFDQLLDLQVEVN